MTIRLFSSLALVAFPAALSAATIQMDSGRGQKVFESEACVKCHAINGKGGHIAPDLGRALDRNFTPASLAGTMWNHAPVMWATMSKEGIAKSNLDEQAAADLFAYFYAARFFEHPGDAGRGKRLFHEKTCDSCHGLTASPNPAAPPVAKWKTLGHPIELTQAMWNHAGPMLAQMQSRKMEWPQLTAQDVADLLVYFRNLPGNPAPETTFITTAGTQGESLFASKGCTKCHQAGTLLSRGGLEGKPLTDIAAAMWDHAPKMNTAPAHFEPHEMRELISYIWANQFFQVGGNAEHGKKIFAAKHCSSCHDNPAAGTPDLSARKEPVYGSTMISVLWRHGPQMQAQMKAKNIRWPRFEANEMSDLIAYLNAKRKP